MVYLLLILYQAKHFLADFPLQTQYMLGKFKKSPNFILPLLAHVAVHGMGTFLIASYFKPKSAFWLALLDMSVHFVVDRIKASPTLGGRWKALTKDTYAAAVQANDQDALKGNTYFWFALGTDQLAHHLTHYFIIWRLLTNN
jgi:hypothetical protein